MVTLACTTEHTEQTLMLGASLAHALEDADCAALVISLEGELGAGKTVFVRGLASALGVPAGSRVVSPTYTIARCYPVARGRLRLLHHLDAYRLAEAEDLDAIGFEEMCAEGCLVCVEWGANVADALPEDRIRMTLEARPPADLSPGEAPECPRQVEVVGLGPKADRVVSAWAKICAQGSRE